ncbi:hypothetical protein GE09DRAFT_1131811 [Coniochaeta sp. 2T2.1]|nr:hypothetical protein GE09DRAFT_1131811 [Coniochaeta sp. 2T2.1]
MPAVLLIRLFVLPLRHCCLVEIVSCSGLVSMLRNRACACWQKYLLRDCLSRSVSWSLSWFRGRDILTRTTCSLSAEGGLPWPSCCTPPTALDPGPALSADQARDFRCRLRSFAQVSRFSMRIIGVPMKLRRPHETSPHRALLACAFFLACLPSMGTDSSDDISRWVRTSSQYARKVPKAWYSRCYAGCDP